jgi:hypothetical protein
MRFVTLRGGLTFPFSMVGELRFGLLNANTVLIDDFFLSHKETFLGLLGWPVLALRGFTPPRRETNGPTNAGR